MRKRYVLVWCLAFWLWPWLWSGNSCHAVTTSGSLSGNEVWAERIAITGNVTVPAGCTLTIEPGTVIRFAANTGLHIYGKLEAVGTAEDRITFTSASAAPTRGIWSGVYFYDSSLDGSAIDHAVIEYASRGVWCGAAHPSIRNSVFSKNLIGIYLFDSSSAISGCVIRESQDHGIYLERSSWSWITNNHITGSTNGIYVVGNYYGGPTIRNNLITNNVGYGIHLGSGYITTISFNTLHVNGTGIDLYTGFQYVTTISSNIITSCNTGISAQYSTSTLSINDLWNNGVKTQGLAVGATDVSLDPLYRDCLIGDLRLREGSPLLTAGADGGEIGAFGGGGNPPMLTTSYTTIPTTSGSLGQNEIWSGLIQVTGNVTVPFGFTLRVEPGTTLRFAANTGLHIYGKLEAVGTAEDRITFTSASAAPTRGIWSGVYFYDSSLDVSAIDHAVIEYASRGVWCGTAHPAIRNSVFSKNLIGIYLFDSSSAITGCVIRESRDHGIYLERSSWSWITNNHITGSTNGIYVVGNYYGGPTLRNNLITNNVGYGIHLGSGYITTISFNTLHVNGTGIDLYTGFQYVTTISSNIITSCNTGISAQYSTSSLSTNDLWNNGANTQGLAAGATDVSLDPLYRDCLIEDLRLREGSPLLTTGADGGEIGAFGGGGNPPMLTTSYTTIPTTSGSLGQNEIWSGLIQVTGNVTVPFGYTLRVEPGTTLRFAANTGLHIYGKLEAVGTVDEPITFTSAATAPTRGIWSGVYFYDSSLDVSAIDHAVIEYASRGVWCGTAHPAIRNSVFSNNLIGVYLYDSSSPVTGCVLRDSRDYGIYLERSSWSLIADNFIMRCNHGVYAYGQYYGGPIIRNNLITNNVGYGIHLGSGYITTISFNTLHANGTGIDLYTGFQYVTTISSNIISSGKTGVAMQYSGFSLRYNDVWNNQTNYSGLSAGSGDISANPLFRAGDDYRLQPGSPCIDAADPTIVDGDGTRADIGAYGGNGGPAPTPGDASPARPTNAFPEDGASQASPSPTLSATAFADSDAGDHHIASRWQIRSAGGFYEHPVYDSGETAIDLRTVRIPWGTLEAGMSYFWHVRYKDNKNSWSENSIETSFTTFKDPEPPDTAITAGPAEGGVAGAAATFAWTGRDAAGEPLRYSYAMDLGGWSAFIDATGYTFKGMNEGPHTFQVRASDYSGNVDPTPAMRNFTVDLTPPVISEVTVPRVTNKSAVISWHTNEPASSQALFGTSTGYGFGTARDRTLVTVHTSTLSNLKANTQYHFSVKSQDQAGNQASSPDFTFQTLPAVDDTPPETTITHGPKAGALLNASQVTLGWSGWDDISDPPGLNYAYRLDEGAWSSFASATSYTFSSVADGEHTIAVKAQDEAHNEDPTPAVRTFTIDTTPPVAASDLAANVTRQGVNLTWLHSPSSDIHGYRLYWNSGAGSVDYGTVLAAVTYPANTANISIARKGVYLVGLRAVDRAENEERNTHLVVTVTLSRPDAPSLQPVVSPTDVGRQTLSGAKDGNTSLWINGTQVVPLSAATTWSHQVTLTEGINRFEVTCRNEAGEESPSVVASIDYESPPLPVSMLTASGSGPGTTVSLSWVGYDEKGQGDVASYRVYAADHPFTQIAGMPTNALLAAGTSRYTVTSLVKGMTYYFAVVAVDTRGNALTAVTPVSAVPTDTAAPEDVTALSVQCFAERLVFSWKPSANSARDLAGYKVYFNRSAVGIPVDIGQDSFERTGLSPATAYPCMVKAVDTSGNESAGTTLEAITLLENPAQLIIQPHNGRLSFSWPDSQPKEYVAQYCLYLSETSYPNVVNMTPRARVAGTSTSIAGLVNDKTYYCAVTAMNRSGGEKKEVVVHSATPLGDKEGPTISDVRFETTPVINGLVLQHSGTFSLSAADPSGMSRVEFRFDGSLYRTATTATPRYTCWWDIAQVPDGDHLFTITAYDTLGNASTLSYNLAIALNPPQPPTILYPSSGQLVKVSGLNVSGRAENNTEVLIFDNDLQAGNAVTASASGSFNMSLTLAEGENRLHAVARNRAGTSSPSAAVVVTLDSTLPQSPTSLTATPKAGGMIALSWRAPAETSLKGFNLHRASNPFFAVGDAARVNGAPLTMTSFDDLPSTDGVYYYRVSCLDRAGNESELSDLASAGSDRTPPRALAIDYVPAGRYDPVSGRIGPGAVLVRLTVSEAVLTTPFLSLTPHLGTPVAIELSKSSDTEYAGYFSVSETTPSGTAHAVFSARDAVGNRGSEVGTGASIVVDATGPALTLLSLQPDAPIRNDETNPAAVVVTIGLNEATKPGTLPQLSFLLSKSGRTPLAVSGLVAIAAPAGQVQGFQATFTLPPDAGRDEAETLQFLYRAADDLDNIGTRILADNRFQVYQGDLPPLDAPEGFTAKSLPAGQIKLSWTLREGADGYQLYRQAPGEGALSAYLGKVKGSELIDSPSLDGRYAYAIASIRHENGQEAMGAMSPPVEAESDSLSPNPPRILSGELLSQGVNTVWQAPLGTTELITYALYRANRAEITSVDGLSPVIKGIKQTTVLDPHPSATDHCYAVTAMDRAGNESPPSNSFYLNCQLLPISTLQVTQQDGTAPRLSWTHPVGLTAGIAGFNIGLQSHGQVVRLNQTPLVAMSYTDAGYAGDERCYTVTAVDGNGVESLGRGITFPMLKATLKAGESLKRGVMNRLEYTVENLSAAVVEHARLKVKAGSCLHTSEEFRLEAGELKTIPIAVGGYADLATTSPLISTISLTPHAGEGVEISRSGAIAVADGMLMLQILNDELTRGLSGKVHFTLENTGEEEIEIITATGSGGSASNEIALQLLDVDGNVLASTPYRQHLGTNIVTLANGNTVARIPAGSVFTSLPVDLSVPLNAPEQAVIKVAIAKVYYHQGKPEQVTMEGLSSRHQVAFRDTAYYGEVSTIDPEVSNGDREIVITGGAIERRTGLPMAGVPLKVVITLNGFERTQLVMTDASGSFVHTFRPLPAECGVYKVRAVHPEILDKPVHGRFIINRVSVTPQLINLSMPRNYEQHVAIQVGASEGTEVHHLRLVFEAADQPEGTIPEGVHVTLGAPVETLGSGRTASLGLMLWADNTATGAPKLIFKVTSDEKGEGSWAVVQITMNLSEAKPVLSFAPAHLETGCSFGEYVFESITLENKGLADLNEVSLALFAKDGTPPPEWAHLNAEAAQGTIQVGEKRPVGLSFHPVEAAVAEGNYTFLLRVSSANYRTSDVPIFVAVTQAGMGQVIFKVLDIYTGTLGGNGRIVQGLKNAAVLVQHETVTTIQQTGTTDDLGEVYLVGLPAGRYRYRVSAADHQERTGTIWVKAGMAASEPVFLDYNLVSVEWEVKETTVEDQYEIVLKVTYETDVPAAVLVAQPASAYFPQMEPGDVYQGEFTLTNHGLIQAEHVSFTLPSSDAYFRYEFPAGLPETIEAKAQLTIPYRVTRLGRGDGGGNSGCKRYLQFAVVSYEYGCAAGVRTSASAPFAFLYDNGQCAGQPPTLPGGGPANGGEGGTWVIVVPPGGDEREWTTPTPPPAPIEGAKCLPVPDRQESMTGKSPTCPLDTQRDVIEEVGSAVNCALREFIDSEEDLSVKVPGGRIAVSRFFYGNQWRWEALRHNLIFVMDSLGQYAKRIDKGGVVYERSAAQSATPLFVHDTYRITQVDNGFRWEDKHGAWRAFDPAGRMTAYGDPSGVLGKLLYESGANGRLLGITDRNDRQVIWFDRDAEGKIIAVRDLANRRVEYGYRDALLASVVDVLGNVTSYEYDARGRMIKKTDAAGSGETIAYDAYGNVAKVVDAQNHGYVFQFDYDAGKREYYARINTSAGMVKEVWYDGDGETKQVDINGRTVRRIVKDGRNLLVTDDRGNVTRKDFDEWKNLTRLVYPDGATVSFDYEHRHHQRVSTTNEQGIRTEYAYDEAGRLVAMIEARGTPAQRETRYRYDSQGNLSEAEQAADAVTPEALTIMEYDALGNLISATDPEGNRRCFTHDVMGNVVTETDANGKVWSIAYDDAGRAVAMTDPLGHTAIFSYDAVGNKIREGDAEGRQRVFSYDEHHRLVSSSDTAGNVTRFEYNTEGRLTRQSDPEGKVSEFAYDSEGRLIKAADGNGNQTLIEYERGAAGCSGCSAPGDQPARISYPTFAREFRYDSRGRKIEERDVLSDTEAYSTMFRYDAAGNLTSITDKESKTTTYTYDELNRLIKSRDAAGHETLLAYDGRDNLLALTDARGNTTRFVYDRNNRQTGEIRPMGQATRYDYEATGRLVKKLDPKSQWAEFVYDDAGRLIASRYYSTADHASPIKTVAFGYDRVGHLVSYDDGVTSARYQYDDAYRKILETVDYGSFQLSSATAWYRNGTKKSFTGPDNLTYGYEYDADNQLMSLEIPEAGYLTYQTTAWNRPSLIIYPGGTVRELTYDPLMRLKSIKVTDPAQKLLMNYGYTYDRMNNITRKSTENGEHAYRYDDLYRLVQADNPVLPDEVYTYDPAGNRLTAADVQGEWVYNANNELQSYGVVSFDYDENGNTIQKVVGGETINYYYDIQNQLTRVETASGSVIAQYYYDPFGRRLWKEVASEKTCFAYADEGLIGEFTTDGHQTKAYGYRPGSSWTTDPLFMKEEKEYYFYQNDHLGTPVQMTGTNGAIVWAGTHSSFGDVTLLHSSVKTTNLRFSGQYFDEETEDHYNYHRYYSPELARYGVPDLLRYYFGTNSYVYANMNPIRFGDSMGLWSSHPIWPVHQAAGWIVFGEALSSKELAIINEAHTFIDSEAFQGGNYAYRHAMRGPYESKSSACLKTRRFVQEQFNKALVEKSRGDIESSLFHFGLALHSMQDSVSPSHTGSQEWTGRETTYQAVFHILKGDLLSHGPALLNATSNAWQWYTSGIIPEDVFECECID